MKWVIHGKELSACSKSIVVPSYDLKFDLHAGTQTVEFTPKEAGVIPWSCWMGMIPGSFVVVDDPPPDVPEADTSIVRSVQNALEQSMKRMDRLEQRSIEDFREWRQRTALPQDSPS